MLKFEEEIVGVLNYLFSPSFIWRGFVLFCLFVVFCRFFCLVLGCFVCF